MAEQAVPQFTTYDTWKDTALADIAATGKLSKVLTKIMFAKDWEDKWEVDKQTVEARDARKRGRIATSQERDWEKVIGAEEVGAPTEASESTDAMSDVGTRDEAKPEKPKDAKTEKTASELFSDMAKQSYKGETDKDKDEEFRKARDEFESTWHKQRAEVDKKTATSSADRMPTSAEAAARGISSAEAVQEARERVRATQSIPNAAANIAKTVGGSTHRHEENLRGLLASAPSVGDGVLAMGMYMMNEMTALSSQHDDEADWSRRTRHAVVKTVEALNRDEAFQNKILILKDKECSMKDFHNKVLQCLEAPIDTDALLDKQIYSVAANGPIQICMVKKQKQMKACVNKLRDTLETNGFEKKAAIFAGKARIEELKEQPLQACFRAAKSRTGWFSRAALDEHGLMRIWPDATGRWAVIKKGRGDAVEEVYAAGKNCEHELVSEVWVKDDALAATAREQLKGAQCLYECTVSVDRDIFRWIGGKGATVEEAKGKGKGKKGKK